MFLMITDNVRVEHKPGKFVTFEAGQLADVDEEIGRQVIAKGAGLIVPRDSELIAHDVARAKSSAKQPAPRGAAQKAAVLKATSRKVAKAVAEASAVATAAVIEPPLPPAEQPVSTPDPADS